MDAKKCYKCGSYYPSGIAPDLIISEYIHPYGECRIELRPDCTSELIKWLHEKKEEK